MAMKERAAPPVPQNLLDKAIAYFAPRTAQRRGMARVQLAIQGGYAGARVDKAALSGWRTSAGSPDSDVIVDLPMLRQRSADLERNAPVGAAIINTSVTHVVGTGLACNPQLDATFLRMTQEQAKEWQGNTLRRFNAWAENPDCDLARKLTFYGVQDLALRSTMSRGDTFVVTPRVQRPGMPMKKLALQLIEADRCSNPDRQKDTDTLTEGILHSADTGEALVYYFADRHPGDVGRSRPQTWRPITARGERSGRRNVLHLYRQLRPGLRRGVPILAPVIEPIKQVSRYTQVELEAAVTSGLFSVFLKMDPEAFTDLFDEDAQGKVIDRATKWSGEMEGGKAINLLPGEEPITSNPGRPNAQFDPFVTACFRQIGMAVGIPYEVLVMHYQSSYSAARGALLLAWRFWMNWRSWLAAELCQPVYELWLADEVAEGRISAPGFFADPLVRAAWCRATWVGDGPGSIDPGKEVAAAADRVALGISTLESESLLHDGVDWETKQRQLVREAEARREAGFMVQGEAPPPPVAPEPETV
jgi:lambda family phage portal protein